MRNQHLIDMLESGDVEVRREAARTLAQYPAMLAIMERDERDISGAIGPLAVVLFDEDAEVRKQAANALHAAQRDRQDISAAILALVRCLSDERVDLRRSASLILRDAVVEGWDAGPYESQLGTLLTDPVDEVKWGSADALTHHFAAQGRWDEVADLLNHADPDVAQETAGTLASFYLKFHYETVVPDLIALLGTDSVELRLVASKAVVHRPRHAADLAVAIPVLLDCLSDEEARIRRTAIRALDSAIAGFFRQRPTIGERDELTLADWEHLAPVTGALPAIERALADENGEVQVGAVEALATFLAALPVSAINRYEQYIKLIYKQLRTRHNGAKRKAAEALTLQWVRAARWDELLSLLGGSRVVKRRVLNTLAGNEAIRTLGFAPLVPAILEILSDPDGDLRNVAQRALEMVDANQVLGPLESEPLDTEARRNLLKRVRGKVHCQSLDPLKVELEATSVTDRIAFLTAQLDHKTPAVRAWAAESLWWIGQSADISAVIPQLVRLLDDPDPSTRCQVAQALGDAARYGSIGQAHAQLSQLIHDGSAEVRKMAFRALEMSAGAGRVLDEVLPALFKTLRADPDEESRGEAAVVVSAASRSSDLGAFVPDLAAALGDDLQRVRFYTARALHYVAEGGASIQLAIPALAKAIEDERTVASWAAAALVLYAADAARAAEVLDATRTLDSRRRQVARVVRACEKRLKGR